MFQPANLLYHAGEHYQGNWFPAYGLLPRWHHARSHACEKPAGLETVRLTYYRDHVEHRVMGGIMATLLAEHQVKLEIQSWSIRSGTAGGGQRRMAQQRQLYAADRFLPVCWLYEVPLIRNCIPIDWEQDAARWRAGELNPATQVSSCWPIKPWCR